MSFVQIEFLIFMAVVLAVYWALGRRAQNLFLLVASLVFYGWVHHWFLGLILYSAVLDYSVGLAMVRHPAHKGRLLALSVLGNLGLLGAFKYAGFFAANVAAALGAVGFGADIPTLDILLPVGISFFTFQTMSYTLDIYRGQLQPRTNFAEYLLFVAFFPQLVAGPIERASRLLPQIEADREFSWDKLTSGLSLALWGAMKKVAIADSLALPIEAALGAEAPSFSMIWAAAAAFALQLFADFSAYTDIARGCARMLGFDLVENFDAPFLATSPTDWWGRWHMSFTSWMHDYVFRPLALAPWFRNLLPKAIRGTGRSHAYRALFVTMVLGGLWHGASWNFVLWGGIWGVFQWIWPTVRAHRWPVGLRLPIMWGVTLVSSLLFVETDTSRLLQYFSTLPGDGTRNELIAATFLWLAAAVGSSILITGWAFRRWGLPRLEGSPWKLPLMTTLWTVLFWLIVTFAHGAHPEFVYFRF